MPARRTLIFDFDGTLADTLPHLVRLSNQLATEYGYRIITEDDTDTLRGKRASEVLQWLNVPLTKMPVIARRLKAKLADEMSGIQPINTVKEVLDVLRKTHTLGIVTSNSVANVQQFLKANDMAYFAFVRSSTVLLGKSRVLRRLLREERLSVAETLYIGDETRDVIAARACGMDTVAVSWGGNDTAQLQSAQPWALIHRPEELLDVIDRG